jgi:acetyltransferase-like isoleucine patch superfamily enzyme
MIEELLKLFEGLIRNIDGKTGEVLRYWYYSKRLGKCGEKVTIGVGVVFQNPKDIFLADNIWIDRYCILLAGEFKSAGRNYLHKVNQDYTELAGRLILARGVHIAPFALLQAHGGLTIGKNVTIASGAKVYTLSHHYKNLADPSDSKRYSFSSMAPAEDQFLISSAVVIKDNAAIGLNSVVLPGTTVQDGSWLGVLTHVQPGQTEVNAVYSSQKGNKS